MQNFFRLRKTAYPRTYFLLNKKKKFYLLFWLEYGKDNSLYVWFDDNPNNSWEVAAVHNQGKFHGSINIELKHKAYEIFDPHISWHPSGNIHVTGYDKKGANKEHIISDKTTDLLYSMVGGTTIPIAQILLPTLNARNSLKYLGKELGELRDPNVWVGTLNEKGFHVLNNGAPREGFFIVDDSLVPDRHVLGFDISAYWKGNKPLFTGGKSLIEFQKTMLYPDSFSINRGLVGTTACLRIFSLPFGDKPKNLIHTLATCFNKDSTDLFQLGFIKRAAYKSATPQMPNSELGFD